MADNWLSPVAAALRSDEPGLRELAQMMGLDPNTMYIGTRMDGCDIRGQDLSGMIFTHLDPCKLRYDDKTVFPEGAYCRLDGDRADQARRRRKR